MVQGAGVCAGVGRSQVQGLPAACHPAGAILDLIPAGYMQDHQLVERRVAQARSPLSFEASWFGSFHGLLKLYKSNMVFINHPPHICSMDPRRHALAQHRI